MTMKFGVGYLCLGLALGACDDSAEVDAGLRADGPAVDARIGLDGPADAVTGDVEPPGDALVPGPCERPGPDPEAIAAFVRAACYSGWASQPEHLSGAEADGLVYAVHGVVQVYFSPEVEAWLETDREGALPDGAMVVAHQAAQGRWLVKVMSAAASFDGWFWSVVDAEGPGRGQFGDSFCASCHASADNPRLTFLDRGGPVDAAGWLPDPELAWPDPPANQRAPVAKLGASDPGFLAQFGIPDVPAEPALSFPPASADHVPMPPSAEQQFLTSDQCSACHDSTQGLSSSRPNMWYPDPEGDDPQYRNYSPYGEWSASVNALSARDPIWQAQIESELFLRSPALEPYTVDVCFSCHGPMGQRRVREDNPDAKFKWSYFHAVGDEPGAEYGALARDGISCTVCHRATGKDLGRDPDIDVSSPHEHLDPSALFTYTAQFYPRPGGAADLAKTVYGPYPTSPESPFSAHVPYVATNTLSMPQALGLEIEAGPVRVDGAGTNPEPSEGPVPQLGESALCGSCHTVIVPAIPIGYQGADPGNDPAVDIAYEQTTYWEWRNSIFENETQSSGLPCQGCHMPSHRGRTGELLARRIAAVESDRFPPTQARAGGDADPLRMAEKASPGRHVLMGLNLFLTKMYQQFPDVLGVHPDAAYVPPESLPSLLNVEDWVSDHAKVDTALVDILHATATGESLEIPVQITNYAGHKLPTGAGFRRAFIQLRVFAGDQVVWASGATNRYGVIVGPDDQPLASEGVSLDCPNDRTNDCNHDPAVSQPHHLVITRRDQVQIYETRSLDSNDRLQTTVLGIVKEFKDNRILPRGWQVAGQKNLFATAPRLPAAAGEREQACPPPDPPPDPLPDRPAYCVGDDVAYDCDYCDQDYARLGADTVLYRIPIGEVANWTRAEARLLYQTVPPYYLLDRFRSGLKPDPLPEFEFLSAYPDEPDSPYGPNTRRLMHIVSRLNLAESVADGWSVPVGNTAVFVRAGGQP